MPERDPEAIRTAAKDRLPQIVREEFSEAFRKIEQKREERREFFALDDSNNTHLTIRVDSGPLPDNQVVRVYGNTSSDNHVILLSDQLNVRDIDTVLHASLYDLSDKRRRARLVQAEGRAAAAGHSQGLALDAPSDIGRRSLLPERFHYKMPGLHPDGRRITRAELPAAVERAGAERNRVSRQTLEELRREAASLPTGEYPKRPVMIGGGAALATRDPDRLLIDGRGRWHVDPIQRIVQTADHMDHLRTTGMGDPYQFANPTERVPRLALQLWENEIAAQGPTVDGMTRLYFDDRNRLLAEIHPSNGSDSAVTIEIEGKPLIATGFQPELVPGVARGVPTVPDATDKILDHLSARSHPRTVEVRQLLVRLSSGEGSAQSALDALESANVLPELRASGDKDVSNALTTLDATANWDRIRELARGRVLLGDEVGEGRFNAYATDHWLVVGMGGTGASAAEAILQENPDARVTILGGEPAFVLQNAVQLKELTERHAHDGDRRLTKIDGRLASLDAITETDGRLRLRVEAVDTKRGADNDIVRQERKTIEAGAVVACLGRVPKAPPVLNEVLSQASSKGSAEGRLMFDDNGQYLGYSLSVDVGGDQHEFEVTGAASRLLPADVFSREDSARVIDVGVTTVPEEAANVPAGFMGTALQAVALEEHRAKGDDAGPTPGSSPGPTDPDTTDRLKTGSRGNARSVNGPSVPSFLSSGQTSSPASSSGRAADVLQQVSYEGRFPFGVEEARKWLDSYREAAEDILRRNEMNAARASSFLQLHADADFVAATAYANDPAMSEQHTRYQSVQKLVFMAAQLGVDNSKLPPTPAAFFNADPAERDQYISTLAAAAPLMERKSATASEPELSGPEKIVRRAQMGMAPPGQSPRRGSGGQPPRRDTPQHGSDRGPER